MPDMNDWNKQVIEEFRANGGKVGGQFEGAPMILITTKGAKSGQLRTTPLVYLPDGDHWVIFASKAGAPTNPDWYHNLLANPDLTIEVGAETIQATARVAGTEERDRLYAKQASINPGFAEYQTKTSRVIPVVVLERR